MSFRTWSDPQSGQRIASVAYDRNSKVFTTQWLTDLNFERSAAVIDRLFQLSSQGGHLVVRLMQPADRFAPEADELPYKILKFNKGQTVRAVLKAGAIAAELPLSTLSLEVPKFAVSFSREPDPQLLTTNFLFREQSGLIHVLGMGLDLARSVNHLHQPIALQDSFVTAVRQLPKEIARLEQNEQRGSEDDELDEVDDLGQ